jgi:hypothetical protein
LTTEGFALEKITPAAGAAPADIPSQHSLLCTTPDPLTARSRDSFGVAGTIDGERSAILRFSAV